jgi:hypothetical protein
MSATGTAILPKMQYPPLNSPASDKPLRCYGHPDRE